MDQSGIHYIIRNVSKGIILLAFFVLLYVMSRKYLSAQQLAWLQPLLDNYSVVLLIFFVSEFFIGIIPPELFIMWALQFNEIEHFVLLILLLASISYLAGLCGYSIGRLVRHNPIFTRFKEKYFKNLELRFRKFGIYLIILAAMTPIPFSGVCMLMGFARYPFRELAIFALSRYCRFGLYAYLFWEVGIQV